MSDGHTTSAIVGPSVSRAKLANHHSVSRFLQHGIGLHLLAFEWISEWWKEHSLQEPISMNFFDRDVSGQEGF